jgi:hypothetical protein
MRAFRPNSRIQYRNDCHRLVAQNNQVLGSSTTTASGYSFIQGRVYSMDTKEKLLVVAIADRWIQIINLDNPTASYKEIKGP